MAAARAGRHRLPHELPPRPPHRAALLHARDSESVPPDIIVIKWQLETLLELAQRQQSQQATKPLGASGAFVREHGRCFHHGGEAKLVIRANDALVRSEEHTSELQ